MRDVQFALGKLAKRLSTRSVRLARMILIQEEARALRWSEVDLEAGTVAVYRSVPRTRETKTEKSRRVFQIPEIAVAALRGLVPEQAADRAKAGTAWKENNLVFCTSPGGPMYATDVRMEFKRIAEKAGLGRDWMPRELRHTFVFGPVGFRGTHRADRGRGGPRQHSDIRGVYRQQLRPATRTTAIALSPLFESKGKTNGGQN